MYKWNDLWPLSAISLIYVTVKIFTECRDFFPWCILEKLWWVQWQLQKIFLASRWIAAPSLRSTMCKKPGYNKICCRIISDRNILQYLFGEEKPDCKNVFLFKKTETGDLSECLISTPIFLMTWTKTFLVLFSGIPILEAFY